MFEVESRYVKQTGDKVNDGDPFIIHIDRKRLKLLESLLNQHADSEPIAEMWQKVHDQVY